MKHEPRPAINMEKPRLTAVSWQGWSCRGYSGLDKQCELDWWSLRYGTCLLALWLCGKRVQKRDTGLCLPFCVGESCSSALSMLPYISVPPCVPQVPFKILPSAGTQREWVWVSLCVGSLRGTAWDSRNFFHQHNPCYFLQKKLWDLNFLALEP